MRLHYREGTLRDISAAARLIEDSPLFSERYRRLAPAIWRQVLQAEALCFEVTEDLDKGGLVAIGMSVFITPEHARHCIEHPRPGLAERVLLSDDSQRLPVLGPREIAAANSGPGLDTVTLHHDLAPCVRQGEVYMQVARNMMVCWCEYHAGYRLNSAMAEGYGEHEKAWITQGGTQRLVSEYDEYYTSRGEDPPPPSRRPHLVLATREDALARPSGVLAGPFLYRAPRFYFGPRERRLLQRAVRGDTDAQLCHSLGISAAAVKKRWNTAYARVLDADPHFFGARNAEPGRRGPEKRHLLVEYVRQHPEEKRPHLRPSAIAQHPVSFVST